MGSFGNSKGPFQNGKKPEPPSKLTPVHYAAARKAFHQEYEVPEAWLSVLPEKGDTLKVRYFRTGQYAVYSFEKGFSKVAVGVD